MSKVVQTALLFLFVLILTAGAFAQGKGKGGGNKGGGGGSNRGGGSGNSANKSKAPSDTSVERARREKSNLRKADDDLRDHPRLPRALHTNANDLRSGYQAALATNPDLTFGNYVSATRLGQNLNSRFPNVTRDAILNGLNSGRSLGQTLQDLGLNEREAKEARKRADDEIKAAKKNK
jgi:hypothetical protein